MPLTGDLPKLHLVHSRTHRTKRALEQLATPSLSHEVGPQQLLFPELRPGIVMFLKMPDLADFEFIEILKTAQPAYIFDLRLAPRFDIGRLNRHTAFALFDKVHAAYVDATVPIMMGQHEESALAQLREALKRVDWVRPVVFLFGSRQGTSLATFEQVLTLLSSTGKSSAELHLISIPASQSLGQP